MLQKAAAIMHVHRVLRKQTGYYLDAVRSRLPPHKRLYQHGKLFDLQGDVRKLEDCARWVAGTVEHFGGLHILVNCAAGNFLAAAEALSPNGFRTGATLAPSSVMAFPLGFQQTASDACSCTKVGNRNQRQCGTVVVLASEQLSVRHWHFRNPCDQV